MTNLEHLIKTNKFSEFIEDIHTKTIAELYDKWEITSFLNLHSYNNVAKWLQDKYDESTDQYVNVKKIERRNGKVWLVDE